MFLFDKKQKKEGSWLNAKTLDIIKNASIAVGLVVGLKAAAYLFNKDS
jgi:hypothetical protein